VAVVFLPGFMQRRDAWAPVAERVAERYPSVVLDLRAPVWKERLAEVRAGAPLESVLVGYSMGGRLALHAALAEPRRDAGLCLVGASAGIEDRVARERRRREDEQLAAWMEQRGIEEVVDRWERSPVFAGQSEELVARQRPGRVSHDPRELASLLRTGGQGALPPVWDRLAELPMPVLALAGERDELYVAAARRLAAAVPHGRAELVAGAGHATPLEAPEATARLILTFLTELG
jgi:2-succinyl-6-hydroxy-2,4-cyclohexadiene-1-carboxylate synthase